MRDRQVAAGEVGQVDAPPAVPVLEGAEGERERVGAVIEAGGRRDPLLPGRAQVDAQQQHLAYQLLGGARDEQRARVDHHAQPREHRRLRVVRGNVTPLVVRFAGSRMPRGVK